MVKIKLDWVCFRQSSGFGDCFLTDRRNFWPFSFRTLHDEWFKHSFLTFLIQIHQSSYLMVRVLATMKINHFFYLLLFQLCYIILYRGKKKRSAMTQLPVTTYPQYTCTKALSVSDKNFLKIFTKRNMKKKKIEHFRRLILVWFTPEAKLP